MVAFTIGDVEVEQEIAQKYFSCDLGRCKGACCTLPGGRGAPVAPDEIDSLVRAIPIVRKYIPSDHLRIVEQFGVVEESDGQYFTACINNRACVFVYYDRGIARCSIEQAYFAGEYAWRKPVSCHLFPIRSSFGLPDQVRFEYLRECFPAIEAGNRGNIPLYEFLRDALIRLYGETWYTEFHKRCIEINAQTTKTENTDSSII
jgi:hypothetical protein